VDQAKAIPSAAKASDGAVRDLRELPWCSIDNDDSRDLDQLSVSKDAGDGAIKILVAVADVDALVKQATPMDSHAAKNTTSVYTAGGMFPMLPERLSTDLTSLNPGVDRMSVVVEFTVGAGGSIGGSAVYRAQVRNQAKLTYNAVAAWLEGSGALSAPAALVPGMEVQLRRQADVAARLRRARREQGALDFEAVESRPVFDADTLVGLQADKPNRAKMIIEEFMIATNGIIASFLDAKNRASLRRVVRSPERWAKIVAVAAEHGESLPSEPSAPALAEFLRKRRTADPLRFPDLSLIIVKLMGRGEYVAYVPGGQPVGHFGLAVGMYSHSTAPNRRFPDLITQRLVKAALADSGEPYDAAELAALAVHCTEQASNATKVERRVRKSAAALVLEHQIGQTFAGVVTGASAKGTYVRIFDPPVEGRIMRGFASLRVGATVDVKLTAVNFERGFLDFEHHARSQGSRRIT
jgi:exoribonuclease-2